VENVRKFLQVPRSLVIFNEGFKKRKLDNIQVWPMLESWWDTRNY